MRLTDDDIAVIRHVAAHRFLRSTHIVSLLRRPNKKVLERLSALYHNGYLDRPRAQLDYYATAGSAPLVYALGNKGAALLAEQDGTSFPKVDWTWKNRDAGRVFIEHTLLVADLMVAIETAVHRVGNIALIGAVDILKAAPTSTQNAKNPWALPARIVHGGMHYDLSLIPDKIFGLDYLDLRKRSYFFVEADRGTMPVTRSHPRQTSFQQKILGYLAGSRPVNTHAQHFGIGNFRVLTVTTTRERIATMVAALKAVTNGTGSNQFLFVDRPSLLASSDVLSLDWTSGKNEAVLCA
ncbi:MAG: replication-relaxation family protein [Pseudorhodoplanes sp.]|nr:replication-relaxation family protein [Pseudorhodoplanes sp.]